MPDISSKMLILDVCTSHLLHWITIIFYGASMTRDNEADIIKNILAGNHSYYKKLIEAYHFSLLRLAKSLVGERYAEDVVQDVWLSVVKALPQFKGESSLKTWLYRMIINRSISKLRQEKAKPLDLASELASKIGGFPESTFYDNNHWAKPPISWQFYNPEDILESDDLRNILVKQIELLPQVQQSVFIMHDIDGLNTEEICNILSITASNVRVLLHRARMQLYKAVEQYRSSVT